MENSRFRKNFFELYEAVRMEIPEPERREIAAKFTRACDQKVAQAAVQAFFALAENIEAQTSLPALKELLCPMVYQHISELLEVHEPSSAHGGAAPFSLPGRPAALPQELESRKRGAQSQEGLKGAQGDNQTGPRPPASKRSKRRVCAGISNKRGQECLNKCYLYACLKGLWASDNFLFFLDQAAQSTRDGQRKLATLLQDFFKKLAEAEGGQVLAHTDPALQALITGLQAYLPDVATAARQDPAELLGVILPELFPERFPFTFIERSERTSEPRICLPEIDVQGHQVQQSSLITINLPPGSSQRFEVSKLFAEGLEHEETVSYESAWASKRNANIPAEERRKIEEVGPKAVKVRSQYCYCGSPPPCLFLHLHSQFRPVPNTPEAITKEFGKEVLDNSVDAERLRAMLQENGNIKIPVHVDVQYELRFAKNLPADYGVVTTTTTAPKVATPTTANYRLQAIIVRAGDTDTSCHYYTYVRDSGQAYGWIRHDDDKVDIIAPGDKGPLARGKANDLLNNPYLLVYDLVEHAPER